MSDLLNKPLKIYLKEQLNDFVTKHISALPRRNATSLDIGRAYVVKEMKKWETPFGKFIFATLLDTSDSSAFTTYLPKEIAGDISDDLILTINNAKGRCGLAYLGENQAESNDTRSPSIKFILKNVEPQQQVTFPAGCNLSTSNDMLPEPPEELPQNNSQTLETKENKSNKRVQMVETSNEARDPKVNDFTNPYGSILPRRKFRSLDIGRAYVIQDIKIIIYGNRFGQYMYAILLDPSDSSVFSTTLPEQITRNISDELFIDIKKSNGGFDLTYLGKNQTETKDTTCSLIKFSLRNVKTQQVIIPASGILCNDVQPNKSQTSKIKLNKYKKNLHKMSRKIEMKKQVNQLRICGKSMPLLPTVDENIPKVNLDTKKRVHMLETSDEATEPKGIKILDAEPEIMKENVETEKQVNQLTTCEQSSPLLPTVNDNIPKANLDTKKRVHMLETSDGANEPKVRKILESEIMKENVETEKQVNQLTTGEQSKPLSPTVDDNISRKCDTDLSRSQDSIEDSLSVFSNEEERDVIKKACALFCTLQEDEQRFLKEKQDLENDIANSKNEVEIIALEIQRLQAKLEYERKNVLLMTTNLDLATTNYSNCKKKIYHMKKMLGE